MKEPLRNTEPEKSIGQRRGDVAAFGSLIGLGLISHIINELLVLYR